MYQIPNYQRAGISHQHQAHFLICQRAEKRTKRGGKECNQKRECAEGLARSLGVV